MTQPAQTVMRRPYAAQAMALGEALNNHSAPGDLVIAVAPDAGDPIGVYFSRRRGWTFPFEEPDSNSTTFPDPPIAIAKLEDLRLRGARWMGISREAKDALGRNLFDYLQPLIAHLNTTADLVVETPDYVIFRLRH